MRPITINDLAKALKVSVGVLLVLCQVNGIEVEDENSEITLEQSALLTQALKENDSVVPSMETKPTKRKINSSIFWEKPKVSKKKWKKEEKEGSNQEPLKNQTYEKALFLKATIKNGVIVFLLVWLLV